MSVLKILASLLAGASLAHAECDGTALQVLGSGGPELADKRASASYLIWENGRARALVDFGGGASLRFEEAGAKVEELDVVLFTHFHVDHSGDFPALIKAAFFSGRERDLPVFGPEGNEIMPGTAEFMRALFAPKDSAFRYLADYLDPKAKSPYKIRPHDVRRGEQEIFSESGFRVLSAPVVHGPLPARAYRVEIGGKSFAFSGDTNGDGDSLQRMAKDADIFVAHNAVPEGATGVERKLHMPPSVIGTIAAEAKAKSLVLSHRMLRTLGKEQESEKAIRRHYRGPVSFADDLQCFSSR
ncbi:MAG: MBL fold metallo-hydrolase [Burkholderiales bacterium]